jgi:hypothetical protein
MAIGPRGSRFRLIPGNWQAFGISLPASLTTVLAGANNDMVWTARNRGTGGNAITVAYVVAGASTPLSIGVVGNAITVNVATNGSSVATSTAAQVKAAVEASAAANALVKLANAASNDGTGVVAAQAATALSGGTDWVMGTASSGIATRR